MYRTTKTVYDIDKEYHIKNTGKAGREVTAVLFVIGLRLRETKNKNIR